MEPLSLGPFARSLIICDGNMKCRRQRALPVLLRSDIKSTGMTVRGSYYVVMVTVRPSDVRIL